MKSNVITKKKPTVIESDTVRIEITDHSIVGIIKRPYIPIEDQLKRVDYMVSSPIDIDSDDDRQQDSNLNPVAVKA